MSSLYNPNFSPARAVSPQIRSNQDVDSQYLSELLADHQKLGPFMQVLPVCSGLLNQEILWVSGMMPNQGFGELDRLRHRSPSPMASSNLNVTRTGLGGWNGVPQERLSGPPGMTMDRQGAPASPCLYTAKRIWRLEIPVDTFPNVSFIEILISCRQKAMSGLYNPNFSPARPVSPQIRSTPDVDSQYLSELLAEHQKLGPFMQVLPVCSRLLNQGFLTIHWHPSVHNFLESYREQEIMEDPFSDDLLIDILLRLPVKSLFDFKCVSKRWYNLISSIYFKQLYQSQGKAQDDSLSSLLGFFLSEEKGAFIPTYAVADEHYSKFPWPAYNGDGYLNLDGGSIISSSNGLLLYYNHHFMEYHVCNPVTKQCISLPQPQYCHFNAAIGFDVEKYFNKQCKLEQFKFKLVCLVLPSLGSPFSRLTIETFSSHTGYWKEYTLKAAFGSILLRPFEYGVVINGVYYWLECMNRVISYDSNTSDGLEEDIINIIRLPNRNIAISERSTILGKSKDGLLQYARSDTFKVEVWVHMPNGDNRNRWVLRHTVSFLLLCHQYPDIMSSCDLILSQEALKNERNANIPELVAFHTLNPSMIFIQLDGKVISYCLDQGRIELVPLRDSKCILGKRSSLYLPGERRKRVFPYVSPAWAHFLL